MVWYLVYIFRIDPDEENCKADDEKSSKYDGMSKVRNMSF